jgi:hypothetical protein
MSPSFVQFLTRVYQFSCRDPNYKDCLLSKLEKWILRKGGLKIARTTFDAGAAPATRAVNIDRYPWNATQANALNGCTTVCCVPSGGAAGGAT